MTLDSVVHKRLRPLASASHRFSPARGRWGVNLADASDVAVWDRVPALRQR
jgi:hypothetical protein